MSRLSDLTNIVEPKDPSDTKLSDDIGGNLGEALAKFDFGQTDLGAQGPDFSDAHAALASMSADDALDYAISQMGPADHFDAGHSDAGHLDMPVDTSHDS
jgi:hypothetical protein